MTPPVLQRLRNATQESHRSLEQTLDIFTWLRSPSRRRRLVARFHQLHQAGETALAPWLGALAGLDFDERARTAFLSRDLAALGVAPIDQPAGRAPSLGSLPAALGLFYVLEGSTLGGRVIDRQLAGEGVGREGLSFLDPYGERTGERWRSFIAVLERETPDPGDIDDAAAAAVEGFAWMQAALCAPEEVRSAA